MRVKYRTTVRHKETDDRGRASPSQQSCLLKYRFDSMFIPDNGYCLVKRASWELAAIEWTRLLKSEHHHRVGSPRLSSISISWNLGEISKTSQDATTLEHHDRAHVAYTFVPNAG